MDDLEAHNKLFEIIGKLGLQNDLCKRANNELRQMIVYKTGKSIDGE